jgi:hypothetical protein
MLSTGLAAAAALGVAATTARGVAAAAFGVDLAAVETGALLWVVPTEWEVSAWAVPVAHANTNAPIPIVAAPIDKRRAIPDIVGIVNSDVLSN